MPSGLKDTSPASILHTKGIEDTHTYTKASTQKTSDIWLRVARAIGLKLLHHQVTLPG